MTYFLAYITIAILGYFAFNFSSPVLINDADDKSSITAVIGIFFPGNPAALTLNVLIAVTVLLTYPLQLFSAVEVLEQRMKLGETDTDTYESENGTHDHVSENRRRLCGRRREVLRTIMRLVTVGVTLLVAVSIPNLGHVIALFGALFGGMVELVLPPLL